MNSSVSVATSFVAGFMCGGIVAAWPISNMQSLEARRLSFIADLMEAHNSALESFFSLKDAPEELLDIIYDLSSACFDEAKAKKIVRKLHVTVPNDLNSVEMPSYSSAIESHFIEAVFTAIDVAFAISKESPARADLFKIQFITAPIAAWRLIRSLVVTPQGQRNHAHADTCA